MSRFVRGRQAHDNAMSLVGTMSYDEAIKAVVGSTNSAWAFEPWWRQGRCMGGLIWRIEPHTEDDPKYAALDTGYWVSCDGGAFRSAEGTGDSYAPESAVEEVCVNLRYALYDGESFPRGYRTEFALAELLGYTGDPESCSWLSRIDGMARQMPEAPSIAPNE